MKCPSCGKELHKNTLFCEYCGTEIRVVPDFETEVENNMEEHLKEIKKSFELQEVIQSTLHQKTIYFRLLSVICCLVGLALIFLFSRQTHKSWNAQQYVEHARMELTKGNQSKAKEYFEEAILLDEERTDAKQELAEICFLQNDKEKYEELLKDLVSGSLLLENDLISCYGKLIALYNASGESQKIKELLLQCTNEAVLNAYDDYYAPPPNFSVKEGYYTKVMPLILNGRKNGSVFYTVDGTLPTEDSKKYQAPIILEEGEYKIRAVYVSKANISSDVVSAEYHIEMTRPEPPVVLTTSGVYREPAYIEVEMEENTRVYYTVDGSIPDKDSFLYMEPIFMPLGKTVFRFVSIKEDLVSEVVERVYEMDLPYRLTEEEAGNHLLSHLMGEGKITDYYGNTPDNSRVYYYTYLTYCVIREKMYYVFRETSSDSNEEMTQLYGVDAMDGTVVLLKYEDDISYSLVEINNP